MPKVNPAAPCMFCGDAPCSCNDLAPKRKKKPPTIKPAPVEQVAPAPAPAGPLAGAFPETKAQPNHTAAALQALLDSSILDKAGRWQVRQWLREEIGDQTNRAHKRRTDEWKERNRGAAQIF